MQGEREGEQSHESNITGKINQKSKTKENTNDLRESDFGLFNLCKLLRNNLFLLPLRGLNYILLKGIQKEKSFLGYVFLCPLSLDFGRGGMGRGQTFPLHRLVYETVL